MENDIVDEVPPAFKVVIFKLYTNEQIIGMVEEDGDFEDYVLVRSPKLMIISRKINHDEYDLRAWIVGTDDDDFVLEESHIITWADASDDVIEDYLASIMDDDTSDEPIDQDVVANEILSEMVTHH
jgi:hypothetical protein